MLVDYYLCLVECFLRIVEIKSKILLPIKKLAEWATKFQNEGIQMENIEKKK